jgi:hypothetical protein
MTSGLSGTPASSPTIATPWTGRPGTVRAPGIINRKHGRRYLDTRQPSA